MFYVILVNVWFSHLPYLNGRDINVFFKLLTIFMFSFSYSQNFTHYFISLKEFHEKS